MSVCLNHPDREATTKCFACHKPICHECAQEKDGHVFCSSDCVLGYRETKGGVDDFQRRDKMSRLFALIKWIVILVIVAVAAAAAYVYFNRNPDALRSLKEKSLEAGQAFKEKVEEKTSGGTSAAGD